MTDFNFMGAYSTLKSKHYFPCDVHLNICWQNDRTILDRVPRYRKGVRWPGFGDLGILLKATHVEYSYGSSGGVLGAKGRKCVNMESLEMRDMGCSMDIAIRLNWHHIINVSQI